MEIKAAYKSHKQTNKQSNFIILCKLSGQMKPISFAVTFIWEAQSTANTLETMIQMKAERHPTCLCQIMQVFPASMFSSSMQFFRGSAPEQSNLYSKSRHISF